MAHKEQNTFFAQLKQLYPKYFSDKKVCEIGSLDINGSVRHFFDGCDYLGVDIGEGPGVDRVVQGQLLDCPSSHFDTMVSAECFEHNPFWVETFTNMLRMTRPGGLVAFSCASTGRPEHGTANTSPNLSPLTYAQGWNYYRNLDAEDFMSTFNLEGWFDYFHFLYCPRMFDLYFYGFRSGGAEEILVQPGKMLINLNREIQAVRLACWARSFGLKRG